MCNYKKETLGKNNSNILINLILDFKHRCKSFSSLSRKIKTKKKVQHQKLGIYIFLPIYKNFFLNFQITI